MLTACMFAACWLIPPSSAESTIRLLKACRERTHITCRIQRTLCQALSGKEDTWAIMVLGWVSLLVRSNYLNFK